MKITLLFGALCLLLSASAFAAGGLVVEFDKDTPASEVEAFTSQYRSIANARQANEKIAAKAQVARAALNGGRGPGPERPVMPDTTGMTVNRQRAAIDAFQAKQAAYDNFQQNATVGKNDNAMAASNSRQGIERQRVQEDEEAADDAKRRVRNKIAEEEDDAKRRVRNQQEVSNASAHGNIINQPAGGMKMDTNGTFYMKTGGPDIISTKDGSFHQKAAGGYINTQTGQFEPSN